MNKIQKEILLKDLCARFPYKVKIDRELVDPTTGSHGHEIAILDTSDIDVITTSIGLGDEGNCVDGTMKGFVFCGERDENFVDGYMCKPYLRPMSSMTKDEWNEYENYILNEKDASIKFCNSLNFYGRHHIDYRGMIDMDLALVAPDDMYEF